MHLHGKCAVANKEVKKQKDNDLERSYSERCTQCHDSWEYSSVQRLGGTKYLHNHQTHVALAWFWSIYKYQFLNY